MPSARTQEHEQAHDHPVRADFVEEDADGGAEQGGRHQHRRDVVPTERARLIPPGPALLDAPSRTKQMLSGRIGSGLGVRNHVAVRHVRMLQPDKRSDGTCKASTACAASKAWPASAPASDAMKETPRSSRTKSGGAEHCRQRERDRLVLAEFACGPTRRGYCPAVLVLAAAPTSGLHGHIRALTSVPLLVPDHPSPIGPSLTAERASQHGLKYR